MPICLWIDRASSNIVTYSIFSCYWCAVYLSHIHYNFPPRIPMFLVLPITGVVQLQDGIGRCPQYQLHRLYSNPQHVTLS